MLTFSQRFSNEIERISFRNRRLTRYSTIEERRIESREDRKKILSDQLRTRLQSEITYLISRGFLERFLTIYDEGTQLYHLNELELRNLTSREIGSDLNTIIDATTLSFEIGTYNDVNFLDFIEIVVIFATDKKQEEMTNRINSIFEETGDKFVIYEGFIFYKGGRGLSAIAPLLKDSFLKKKIESSLGTDDFQTDAKISADMIQYIFSSDEKQSKTKKVATDAISEISKRIIKGEKVAEFEKNFTDLIKIAKTFNNTIQDIRHSDKHTIPVDEPNIYKLISRINLDIAEIAILATPEKYVLDSNIKEIKETYINKYKIERNKSLVIPLDDENLPF